MKKILGLFLLAASSLFGVAVNDIKMSQATSASPPAYVDRFVTPVADGLIGTGTDKHPVGITIGANLTLSGGVLSATSTGGSVNWGSIGGTLSSQADLVAALAAKQNTLTFSTGLTNTSGTITVNATQLISRLSNLTTNGFVKTGSANGTLSIDTSTYLTANQTITLSGDASGSGGTSIAVTVSKINGTSLGGLATGILKNTTTTGVPSIAAAATDYVAPGAATTSGLTMSTARLLGRTTASTGAIQEITVGSGLSLSAGSLTATGGSGSVTTVSVVTANGVSGSVANPTTTPAITLTLGAITPSTVNALTLAAQTTGFTIAGGTSSRTLTLSGNATLSGTNTGDQTTITGNAGTATALQTARAINGTDFDGTAAITVTADASTLTNTVLNSTVVTSSLTAVGVIGTGAWQGSVVNGTYGGTGVNNGASLITIGGSLTFSGAFSTTFIVSGTTSLTLPTTGTIVTTTAINTFAPAARSSGVLSYLTVTMPADTGITTTVESIGVNFSAGTRTWATGAVTLQRERVFGANTIAAAGASTFSTAVNVDIADPIAGTNATLTAAYGLRAANVLFTNSLTVGVASTATGTILLKGTTSGTVTLSVAAAAGTTTFKFPTTAGSNTNVLVTDGSGNTSWSAAGSGVAVGDSPTWTGIHTWTPTARTSGVAAYYTVTAPTDTGLTTNAEALGVNFATATRTHASNTGYTSQRDYLFAAITHAFASATGTITNGATVTITDAPIVGTNAAITNRYALWLQAGSLGFGASGSIASISQSSGALSISAAGSNQNVNITPIGTGIVSVAYATPQIVLSDASGTRAWQGIANANSYGIYAQNAGSNNTEIHAMSLGGGTRFTASIASGSFGSLTATASGVTTAFSLHTYGGSTWTNVGFITIGTSELQSQTARGSEIAFATSLNTTTTRSTQFKITNDGKFTGFNPTGGIGYGTGSGGAITQGTNRTTGVTLNTITGAITLISAAGTATAQSFTVTDSAVAALDTVIVSQTSGTDLYEIFVTNVAAGSFKITYFTTGGTTTEQPVFHFNVIKGVSS